MLVISNTTADQVEHWKVRSTHYSQVLDVHDYIEPGDGGVKVRPKALPTVFERSLGSTRW